MRGARRYYRPEDVEALKTIKVLLYNKGYTIKGARKVVQKGEEAVADVPSSRPVASVCAPAAKKKTIDKSALVSELRVLKSMLTSLL